MTMLNPKDKRGWSEALVGAVLVLILRALRAKMNTLVKQWINVCLRCEFVWGLRTQGNVERIEKEILQRARKEAYYVHYMKKKFN